jgi:hypothetical protein
VRRGGTVPDTSVRELVGQVGRLFSFARDGRVSASGRFQGGLKRRQRWEDDG